MSNSLTSIGSTAASFDGHDEIFDPECSFQSRLIVIMQFLDICPNNRSLPIAVQERA